MSLIDSFARHRIAPNLLMIIMIIGGLMAVSRIEKRFFPEFEVQVVEVRAVWLGASAEDVADSLLVPLENELRNVSDLKEMTAFAYEGMARLYLEFYENVDLDTATEDVQRYVDIALGQLPQDSEQPEVQSISPEDPLLRLSLLGQSLESLQLIARQLENNLLAAEKVRVDVSGLPKYQIDIRFSQRDLTNLNLRLEEIASQITAQNINISAGDVESQGVSRVIRTLSKKQSLADLSNLLIIDGNGNSIRLGDISQITKVIAKDEKIIFVNRKPAVQFDINRPSGGDIIKLGRNLEKWVSSVRQNLPAGMEIIEHKSEWRLVEDRLSLLLKNGLEGLILVLLFLFFFLNWRIAFWISAGIPVTFMASLCALLFIGGSIDMITMFAFIMTTGIIVDDAIVVGENAEYKFQKGIPPLEAAITGGKEMLAPIVASVSTTIASFMPLLIIGGPIGSILFVIPVVVICVLLAALFECFFILPGHLGHTFEKIDRKNNSRFREWVDRNFNRFQEHSFRPIVSLSLRYRWVTIMMAITFFILSISLLVGGAVKYRFFPGADLARVVVQAKFISGTPRTEVEQFMQQVEQLLYDTIAEFPEENLLEVGALYMGSGISTDGSGNTNVGDEAASMYVEFLSADKRETELSQIIEAWQQKIPPVLNLDILTIEEEQGGPPGEDLQIRLYSSESDNLEKLKQASIALQSASKDVPGVFGIRDDMPYGKQQYVFELTSLGHHLNLSSDYIARQLRFAFDGYDVQTFYEGVDEIDLRVLLEATSDDLNRFRIQLPNGKFVSLSDVVSISTRKGFDTIQHVNAEPVVNIIGEVDFSVTDANTVYEQIETKILPSIEKEYGISYSFEGARADEVETLEDMKLGLMIAFILIFLTLAAVFSSWVLPLIIIVTAPLGVIGAILGHWVMDVEMSILSLFGVFTLNGIVINDSIILVRHYLQEVENLRLQNKSVNHFNIIIDSVCRRFRAILLTSLTTVGGLTPLMFETSTQAQFLVPMAISICFGLAFATLLILFLMPSFLSIYCSIFEKEDKKLG